jgi:alkylation response protein AidB-like acyl-CoA dehydrogenase
MDIELTAEQMIIRDTVRRAANEKIGPLAKEIDKEGKFSWEVYNLLFDLGLITMTIPENYGGLGNDWISICIAIEELSKVDPLAGNLIYAQIASFDPLITFGTDLQKSRYLTRVVNERKIVGISITEPGAGSDVKGIQTRATKKEGVYTLNGTKCMVSYGGVSEFFVILAVSGVSKGQKIISAFLVERDFGGVITGNEGDKLGLRGQNTCDLFLEDVPVPEYNLIGEEGKGPSIVLGAFDLARLGLAAQSVGLAEGAFDYSLEYAKQRIQFGRPIVEFQAIQMMLADMTINIEAARSLMYKTALLKDKNDPRAATFIAMSKVFCSDTALKVAIDAVQVLGGYGCFRDHPVEKMMRDAKMLQIIDGTNQINRIVVARTMQRSSRGWRD